MPDFRFRVFAGLGTRGVAKPDESGSSTDIHAVLPPSRTSLW